MRYVVTTREVCGGGLKSKTLRTSHVDYFEDIKGATLRHKNLIGKVVGKRHVGRLASGTPNRSKLTRRFFPKMTEERLICKTAEQSLKLSDR